MSKTERDVGGVMQEQAMATLEEAKTVASITDHDSYARACVFELRLVGEIEDRDSYFVKQRKITHDAWQTVISEHKRAVDPFKTALELVSKARIAYEQQAERKRKAAEAEAQRRAVEAQKAEASQLIAALDDADEAEAIKTVLKNAPPPVVVIESDLPEIAGAGSREHLDFKIVNENNIKRKYLRPDEVEIRKVVKALGKEAEKIVGGIEVIEDTRPYHRKPNKNAYKDPPP